MAMHVIYIYQRKIMAILDTRATQKVVEPEEEPYYCFQSMNVLQFHECAKEVSS